MSYFGEPWPQHCNNFTQPRLSIGAMDQSMIATPPNVNEPFITPWTLLAIAASPCSVPCSPAYSVVNRNIIKSIQIEHPGAKTRRHNFAPANLFRNFGRMMLPHESGSSGAAAWHSHSYLSPHLYRRFLHCYASDS